MTTNAAADMDHIRRVLEERARLLARAPEPASTEPTQDLLVLAVGAERYGVELRWVQEIQPLTGLTAVPGTPAFWAGVVNLRGRLYPVLDLRRYLAPPDAADAGKGRMVLVAAAGLSVALAVDEVHEVRPVPLSAIRPGLAGGTTRSVIRGVTADLLSVLDLEALLADEQLIVQDQTA